MAELQLSLRRGAAIAATALWLASCAPIMPPAPPPYYGWYFPPPAPSVRAVATPVASLPVGSLPPSYETPDDGMTPEMRAVVAGLLARDAAREAAQEAARKRHHEDAQREARNATPVLPAKPAPAARVPAADNDCVGWWRICHF